MSHIAQARQVLGFLTPEELAEVTRELGQSKYPDILLSAIRREMETCGLHDQAIITQRMRALLVLGFNNAQIKTGLH